jgi:hypothetical protein
MSFLIALGSLWLGLICGLFRHPSRPKIDTYIYGMCNFPLNMRLRQAKGNHGLDWLPPAFASARIWARP